VLVCKDVENSASHSRKISKPLLAWLALLPLLILTFYPALSGPFILDDSSSIQSNPEIRRVSIANLVKLFRGHRNVGAFDHHPVSALSAMIDYQWAGLDPFGFHISNLFYHWLTAGAAMVLFLTIWRIRRANNGEDPGVADGFWMAASLMFVWSIHPFATMPVAYVTGRQETLLVLFYLASMICLLRGWQGASYGFAIASFLCKEVAVSLPGALFLMDWARSNTSIIETFRQKWRFYFVLTVSWLMLCFYHLRGGRSHEIGVAGLPLGTVAEYFKAQCGVIAGYVAKMFWPVNLQFYPYIRPVESWTEWAPALIGLALYAGLAIYSLRWSRWLAVAFVFPLLVLSPTSSFIPIPYEPAMEYRMYLPSVAIFGLLLAALWKMTSRHWLRLGIPALAVICLAIVSHLRSRDYETVRKLYEHDIAINDKNFNALEALGGINLADKRYDRSAEYSWKMVDWAMAEKNKEFASRGYNNLGLVEFHRTNYAAAKDYYQRAISLNGSWHARFNMATTHLLQKEFEPAEKLLKEYLVHSPDHPDALLMLYETRISSGRIDEAAQLFDHFMSLYPERVDLDSQRTRILNKQRTLREAGGQSR